MSDRTVRAAVYGLVAVVAVFAFVVSYAHIYDLARGHGQHGVAAKGTPFSVDLLIVAASLNLWAQKQSGETPGGLARWLPRLLLWAGIGAKIAANVAYGWPFGWLGALISAWPGAVFAGLVEMVMVTARPVQREAIKRTVITAGQPAVPASSLEAARVALEASRAAGNPLTGWQVHKRYGIPRSQADKLAKAALNGHADA